jgi:hypothetical protein
MFHKGSGMMLLFIINNFLAFLDTSRNRSQYLHDAQIKYVMRNLSEYCNQFKWKATSPFQHFRK